MKISKRIISVCVSLALLVSACYTATPVYAAEKSADLTGTIGKIGTTSGSKTGLTYKDTFTEDWEGGLDLDKWFVEKYQEDYVSDFQVVNDPLNTGNKVITFSRLSTWLIPTDEYWPSQGLTAGEMKTVKFRMYFNPVKPEKACITGFHRGFEPGIVTRYASPTLYDGYSFAFSDKTYWNEDGLLAICSNMNESWIPSGQMNPWQAENYFVPDFDLSDWIDVTIEYDGTNMSFVAVDKNGMVANAEKATSPISYGKFVIGNRLLERITNDCQTNGNVYIDDIKITFTQSRRDSDVEQKDVVAYYAGNTFLNPGDMIDITGEKLGTTVLSAKIKKIDTVVSDAVSNANYVNETTYDTENLSNVTWEQIPSISDTEMELDILQRSESGIKMVLPNGSDGSHSAYADKGSYALLLEAASDEGKDAIVIINNPQISMLLHNDGNYATPNGWVKIGGYNLSVQNDVSKVSAIIIDENGNRIQVANHQLKVDTTENNDGVSNDYYIMVNLSGMKPGKYQIMLHNGYGGDYGWSMPYDFTVEAKASNEIWRAKGTFNVQDYGAIGNSLTNDTAAIMNAINAAEQNGGGVVYFPKLKSGKGASYRITQPLIVGENISLVGDGHDLSIVFYDGMLDTDMQEYFITYEGNFEISNIQFVCMTNPFKNFVQRSAKKHAKPSKVYIRDSYLLCEPKGAVTNAGLGTLMEGYTDVEAYNYMENQWKGTEQYLYRQEAIEDIFFCVDKSELRIASKVGQMHAHFFVNSDYSYFNGFECDDGEVQWSILTTNVAGFFENGTIQSLSGHMSYRNVASSNNTVNNRELFLRDGGTQKVNIHIQPLTEASNDDEYYRQILAAELEKYGSEKEKQELVQKVKNYAQNYKGRVYRFLDYATTREGWIYVTYGQGAGQIRKIEHIEKIGSYYYFAVDDAFAVTPNRSSEIAYARNIAYKSIVNNGIFTDGSYVGPYGAAVDVVFDHITMRNASSGVGFTMAYEGFVWYCTAKRVDARNIAFMHTSYGEQGATAGMIIGGQIAVGNAFMGFRYCDSYIGEGGSLTVKDLALLKKVEATEIIFENIQFASETPGMIVEGCNTSQGVMLKDIVQHTAIGREDSQYSQISPYTSSSIRQIRDGLVKKVLGTPAIWCDGVKLNQQREKGDINNDGMISLKDADLLRYFLGESMTSAQLDASYGGSTADVYADATEDGTVDARDFLYVRAYILGDEEAMAALKVGGGSIPNPGEPDKPEEDKLIIIEDEVILDYSNVKDDEKKEEEDDNNNPELDYDGVKDED